MLHLQVVFLGLDILVPLMRDEQLKFPKLARAYFTLLSYMLEVYPERVASCPGKALALALERESDYIHSSRVRSLLLDAHLK